MAMTLDEAVWQDDDRMSGAVCFRGTRLPVSILFDYLTGGHPVEDFIRDYEADPAQVRAVLDACHQLLLADVGDREKSA